MRTPRIPPEGHLRLLLAVGGTIFEQCLATIFWGYFILRWSPQGSAKFVIPVIILLGLSFTYRHLRQRLKVIQEEDFDQFDTVVKIRTRKSYLEHVELEHQREKIKQWASICAFGGFMAGGLSWATRNLGVDNLPLAKQFGLTKAPEALAAAGTLVFLIFCALRWNHHIGAARKVRLQIHTLEMRLAEWPEWRPAPGVQSPSLAAVPWAKPETRESAALPEIDEAG